MRCSKTRCSRAPGDRALGKLSCARGNAKVSRLPSGASMSLIPSAFVEKSWYRALSRLDTGTLEFVAPGGEVTIARGANPGPSARFQIAEWDVLRRIMARGDIGL